MSKPSYGIIVGRFQVPELHDGHLDLFRAVKARHTRVIVFIGVSAAGFATRRNPLDFETRRRMIQAKFPDFSIHPIKDRGSDELWSKDLDVAIDALTADWGEIVLYGSRDSFIPHYTGKYLPVELTLSTPFSTHSSGTTVRAALTNTIKESYDFRAGVIYAVNNRRPLVSTTVDIAILHRGPHPSKSGDLFVLLAQKPGVMQYRFVGGFAEPNSDSFEADVIREVQEETSLEIHSLEYLGSRKIHDWRYDKEEDVIKTLMFVGYSTSLGARAGDDIHSTKWFTPEQLIVTPIVREHEHLYHMLDKYLRRIDEKSKSVATD